MHERYLAFSNFANNAVSTRVKSKLPSFENHNEKNRQTHGPENKFSLRTHEEPTLQKQTIPSPSLSSSSSNTSKINCSGVSSGEIMTKKILKEETRVISTNAVSFVAIVERCPLSVPKKNRRFLQGTILCTCNELLFQPSNSSSSVSTSASSSTSSCILDHPMKYTFLERNLSNTTNENEEQAKDTLLKSPSLVFPPDLPQPDLQLLRHSEPPFQSQFEDIQNQSPSSPLFQVNQQPSVPTPPISESLPLHHQKSKERASSTANQIPKIPLDIADVLPLSSKTAYEVLMREPSSAPAKYSSIRFSKSINATTKIGMFPNSHELSTFPEHNIEGEKKINKLEEKSTSNANTTSNSTVNTRDKFETESSTSTNPRPSIPTLSSILRNRRNPSLNSPEKRTPQSVPREYSYHYDHSEKERGCLNENIRSKGDSNPYIYSRDYYSNSLYQRRHAFRYFLLSTKTHIFTITSRDGSRQFIYCRPVSHTHSIVLMSTAMHPSIYIPALERAAARYAILIDEALGLLPANPDQPELLTPTLHKLFKSDIWFCPPDISKNICSILWDSIRGHEIHLDVIEKRNISELEPNTSIHEDNSHENSRNEKEPSSSGHWFIGQRKRDRDSGGSENSATNIKTTKLSISTDMILQAPVHSLPPWEVSATLQLESLQSSEINLSSVTENNHSKENISSITSFSKSVLRCIELADSTLLFRYFSVRSIICVIVALLEERRVCIVGSDSSILSRTVIAFMNLLKPFEWPHTVSPILVERMLPILCAPFPFLVGIFEDDLPETKTFDLDDVVFADMSNGSISSVGEIGDLFKRVPRKIRHKIERRLSRAKYASTKQSSRCKPFNNISNISHTASAYLNEEEEEYNSIISKSPKYERGDDDEKASKNQNVNSTYNITYNGVARLFKYCSFQKLESSLQSFDGNIQSVDQNIWLDHSIIIGLDKTMRKFFSELIEDLDTAMNLIDETKTLLTDVEESSKSRKSRREIDRYQLVRMFSETQMFMQWKLAPDRDPKFGFEQQSQARKRTTRLEAYWNREIDSEHKTENEESKFSSSMQRIRSDDEYEGEKLIQNTNANQGILQDHFSEEVEVFGFERNAADNREETEDIRTYLNDSVQIFSDEENGDGTTNPNNIPGGSWYTSRIRIRSRRSEKSRKRRMKNNFRSTEATIGDLNETKSINQEMNEVIDTDIDNYDHKNVMSDQEFGSNGLLKIDESVKRPWYTLQNLRFPTSRLKRTAAVVDEEATTSVIESKDVLHVNTKNNNVIAQ